MPRPFTLRWLIPASVILLVAFTLRAYDLAAQSLWFDEGWSWHLATLPLDQMAQVTAADRSPALYYALLHGWIQLAGQSEFALRFLSVCADMATVALVMAFARLIAAGTGNTRSHVAAWSPIAAGVLYALCPFALWYAQETRMYALVAALCTASSYWLWRWLHRSAHVRSLAASAALLALAAHAHYYAIFLLPAHGSMVLLWLFIGRRRAHWRVYARWLLAAAGVIVVLVPWLLYASTGFAYDDGFVFPLNTVIGRVAEWVRAFASGGLGWPAPEGWEWVLLAAALAGTASFMVARRWRGLLCVVILIAGPLFAAAIAVRLVYPYRSVFHPRYLIYVVPLACVLIAGMALSRMQGTRSERQNSRKNFVVDLASYVLPLIALLAIGVLWLPALYANYGDPRVARDDVRGAVRHVVEALEPRDVVVMTRDNYAVRYYVTNLFPSAATAFIAMPEGLHGVLESDQGIVQTLNALQPKRVRLFLWQDDVVDPQKLVESTLWAHGYEIGEITLGRNRLPLYQVTRLPLQSLPLSPVQATFGDKLDLTAYWMRTEGVAGDWCYVVLAWTPRVRLDTDYKVFVHVWDAAGQPVFQQDKRPLNDLLPMSSWTPGQILRDPYAMVIPADLPPGEYNVAVGVYTPSPEAVRLPVQSGSHPVQNTAVILGTLRVTTR